MSCVRSIMTLAFVSPLFSFSWIIHHGVFPSRRSMMSIVVPFFCHVPLVLRFFSVINYRVIRPVILGPFSLIPVHSPSIPMPLSLSAPWFLSPACTLLFIYKKYTSYTIRLYRCARVSRNRRLVCRVFVFDSLVCGG